jgi:hypothetical protein
MFPILLGVAIVSGLVAFASKVNPKIRPSLEKQRLEALKRTRVDLMTLDMAEDGLVLARRFHDSGAENNFRALVMLKKKNRGSV